MSGKGIENKSRAGMIQNNYTRETCRDKTLLGIQMARNGRIGVAWKSKWLGARERVLTGW